MTIISFDKLLVCDWDNMTLEEILDIISKVEPTLRFKIYKTYNGYHGYCVSRYCSHSSFATIQLMHKMKCDPYYMSFTKLNGFAVRLTKKQGRNEEEVERYIMDIGDSDPLPLLEDLVMVKDNYISKYGK
jgi:hypothetical protein